MFYTPRKMFVEIYKNDKLQVREMREERRQYILDDMLRELYPNINTETLIRRYYHAEATGNRKVKISEDEYIIIWYLSM